MVFGAGFYFDEDDCSVCIDHYQVNFTGLAGVVARESFQAFFEEEFFAAFFAPSAEQFLVGQQPGPVGQ